QQSQETLVICENLLVLVVVIESRDIRLDGAVGQGKPGTNLIRGELLLLHGLNLGGEGGEPRRKAAGLEPAAHQRIDQGAGHRLQIEPTTPRYIVLLLTQSRVEGQPRGQPTRQRRPIVQRDAPPRRNGG